jgi:hypothetical protein
MAVSLLVASRLSCRQAMVAAFVGGVEETTIAQAAGTGSAEAST